MVAFLKFLLKIFPLEVICSPEGEPYLLRYTLFWTPWAKLYVHNIIKSDEDRDLHDHPWDFHSMILSGGYIEYMSDGPYLRKPGEYLKRVAKDLHRIELVEELPAWTMVICGHKYREWGFQTKNGWTKAEDFLHYKDLLAFKIVWQNGVEMAKVVGELCTRLSPKDAMIVDKLYGDLVGAETDSAYWEAKYNGTWPDSKDKSDD